MKSRLASLGLAFVILASSLLLLDRCWPVPEARSAENIYEGAEVYIGEKIPVSVGWGCDEVTEAMIVLDHLAKDFDESVAYIQKRATPHGGAPADTAPCTIIVGQEWVTIVEAPEKAVRITIMPPGKRGKTTLVRIKRPNGEMFYTGIYHTVVSKDEWDRNLRKRLEGKNA